MEKLDRRERNASATEDIGLDRDVVEMVLLQAGAALHFAQAPGPLVKPLKHVYPQADAVILKSGIKDRRNACIVHQGCRAGDRFRVLPGLLGDRYTARK